VPVEIGLSKEAREYMERVQENVDLLTEGWDEKVEYSVVVLLKGKHVEEKRARRVKQKGLLAQLREFAENKDTDRSRKAERGSPRVKQPGRPPGDMQGMFTLDEITCDAYMFIDRLYEEAERDRLGAAMNGIHMVLRGLPFQVSQFADARPDLARAAVKKTEEWVDKARRALRLVTGDVMFGDTVCGNCGGGLAIAVDNSSDVRCVGHPTAPPCGETYPRDRWLELYTGKKLSGGG
jgi:hypothetical protein